MLVSHLILSDIIPDVRTDCRQCCKPSLKLQRKPETMPRRFVFGVEQWATERESERERGSERVRERQLRPICHFHNGRKVSFQQAERVCEIRSYGLPGRKRHDARARRVLEIANTWYTNIYVKLRLRINGRQQSRPNPRESPANDT